LPAMGADTIGVRQQGKLVVNDYTTSRATRYLPQVAIATTLVAVLPIAVVWWVHAHGLISSPWALVALAIALSLAASLAGSAYWKRHSGANDVFFSELLLWGWLHRFVGERRLAKAVGKLGLGDADSSLPQGEVNAEGRAELLKQMAAAVDAQDPYTDGHSRRVALHTAMVARRMGLSREQVSRIRTAAAVHDIGKLRIPSEVLNKPGELTPTELELVKRHADEGAAIVACMDDPDITAMVRHHHERFDGQGYPAGLESEQIPLGARIIAVADTFDALTSVRPYRVAIPHKKALDVLVEVSGTQLDPVAVRAFLKCYSGNRALLFWTLLAISPQRAVSWLQGKAPAHGSLASAAPAAATAAAAAVVAAAIGPSTSVASRYPLHLAHRPPAPIFSGTVPSRSRGSRRDPRSTSTLDSHAGVDPSRHAVLGVSLTRRRTGGSVNHGRTRRLSGGGTRSATSPGRSGSRGAGGSGGGRGGRPGAGSGSKPGGGRPGGVGGSGTGSPAGVSGTPAVGGSGGGGTVVTTGSSGSGASTGGPSTSSGGPSSGGPPTAPGGNGPGSSGGGPGGGGSGGSGGGNGGGSGGGNGGGSGGGNGGGSGGGGGLPTNKDQCKNGGWAQYGFPNQGQCVAFVERGLH
jgi:HD-GYP domain-containing protein (c-di-GMP phosphodiesterase class II)